jgi:hypothetical protein
LSAPPAKRRNHLLIAGTGRAGTSFLVRYLTGLGLDTTLSRQGDGAAWDEHAGAGLEELPVIDHDQWPYVVKTPWLYQFVDQLLADGSIGIDAVIIPVRPLQEAAASRVILELRAIYSKYPWIAGNDRPWTESWATAGGCLMPLEPLDQARILAVGFYHLVERLVRAEVPMVFAAFPRLAEDADYLYSRLAPFLPGVSAAAAREVHAGLAEPAMVRVGDELQSVAARRGAPAIDAGPDLAALNDIAVRRELVRIHKELAAAMARASDAVAAADQAREQLQELERRNQALAEEAGRLGSEADASRAALAIGMAEKAAELDRLRADLGRLAAAHQAVLDSTFWRLTRPVRSIGARIPPTARNRLRQAIGRIWSARSKRP